MAVSSSQVASYIEGLNLEVGSPTYDLFNRLLLINSNMFRELIEELVTGRITIQDIAEIGEITDATVESFLFRL